MDTGSSRSIIDRNLIKKYKPLDENLNLVAAGGNRIQPLGTGEIFIELGELKGRKSVLVVENLSKPLILGNDFLDKNNAEINYGTKTVRLTKNDATVTLDFGPTEFTNCISTMKINPVKSASNQSTQTQTENEEEGLPEINLIQENPINIFHNEIHKVCASNDIVLKPETYSQVALNLPVDVTVTDLSNYEFIEKDEFLRPRGILLYEGPDLNKNTWTVHATTKKTNSQKIYKGTTIGYLQRKTNHNLNELSVLQIEDDEEVVTLEDHKIGHIKDEKLKNLFKETLLEFSDVFSKTPKYMGKTNLVEHKIDVGDAKPIKSKAYRVSQKEKNIIDRQIAEMEKYDIIRPSQSPWASPVVLVKKKSGESRFCVDYRKLNDVTRKSAYTVPNIDDILTYLGNSKYFSTLDMYSGFWQVPISEDSKQYTAFQTQGHGLWEFNYMSFGLCNAPATFQALADRVFRDMKWKEILIYMDDIIIFSKTIEEHLSKLRKVFQRLRNAGLTLKPSKCEYLKEKINVLGYSVSREGLQPDESKLIAIRNFPTPKNVKSVQSFLGLCNYYRKFIKNFSQLAKPLYEVTHKDRKFIWGGSQEEAFQILKEKLCTAPVLAHYNPEKPTELRVDGSLLGVGAVLLQEDEERRKHPIAYASRTLSKAEKNYTITEIEGLAAVWALRYLRSLIYGKPVKVVTDHHALCWLKTLKDPIGRLARWAITLSEFDYTIEHKSGVAHKDADCVSRHPVLPPEEVEEVDTFLLETTDIQEFQNKDETIRKLVKAVEHPENASIGLAKRAKNFRLENGVLYRINSNNTGRNKLLVIPKALVGEIMYSHHSEPLCGHLGMAKTLHKIKDRYYWDGLQKDVERFVKGCADCQARKGQQNRKPIGLLQPIPVGTPFERIGIDLLGPFRKSRNGNTMIVVATDYATRWAETKALPNGKTGPVAKFILENIVTRHGAPKYLLSDRGKVFQSELVNELIKKMGTTKQFTTAYHPSTNGLTERLNKTLADMLSIYTNTQQTDWDEYLGQVTFAYNTSRQDTTKFSPFMLVYGREPILPTEANLIPAEGPCTSNDIREGALAARNQAVRNIQKKQQSDKIRYDSKHRHVEYAEGDQVKVFTPFRKVGRSEKLLLRWSGPYYITKKVSDVDYEVQMGTSKNSKKDIIHISRILPYNDPWTPETYPKDDHDDSN